MNNRIVQLLEEVINHLSSSQGRDFKDSLDQSKQEPSSIAEGEGDRPKGISIQKVSVTPQDKNPDDKVNEAIAGVDQSKEEEPGSDMSDEELSELEALLKRKTG